MGQTLLYDIFIKYHQDGGDDRAPWTATPADDVPAELSAGARHRVVPC